MNNGDSFIETFTYEKYVNTSFMQLGGNWLDFSRVEQSSYRIDLSEYFFPTILEGFLPSIIRDEFFSDFYKNRLSFGNFFASNIGEDGNALRLNFTNEIFFSFGYIGVVVYSFILGVLLRRFDSYLMMFNYPIGIFFFMQIMSLHILGSNTFSNMVILTCLIIFFFKMSFTKRKEYYLSK